MQIAVLATSWDAPMTLASTSFIKAVVGGAIQNGDNGLVILLRRGKKPFKNDESLSRYPHQIINTMPQTLSLGDHFRAAQFGLRDWKLLSRHGQDEWQSTYLLAEVLLTQKKNNTQNVLMVYPRSYQIFQQAVTACKIAGWQIGCFATEQLTGAQIELSERDQYNQCVIENASVVWAVSSHLAHYWTDGGLDQKKVFINPSVHEMLPKPRTQIDKTFTAAYVGNIAPLYWNMILDIAKFAIKEIENFSLCVYCDVRDEDLVDRQGDVKRLGLESVITLKRGLTGEVLHNDLHSSRILLAPRSLDSSHQYGFPHKLGEYLLAGIPVVASAGGDIPEYFSENELFLAPPEDTVEFVRQMKVVLDDVDSANHRATNGKVIATELLWSPNAMRRFREHIRGISH